MNPKVQQVKEYVSKAYNLVSQKIKLSANEILKTEIAHKTSNAMNPINHKLILIYISLKLIQHKNIDEIPHNILIKETQELYDEISKMINNNKKHKLIVAAILVAIDYIIVKTMIKPVSKLVPNGVAKFTYSTLAGGLNYVIEKIEKVNQAEGKTLKDRLINALKSKNINFKSLKAIISNTQENSKGGQFINQMFGAPPHDTSDNIRIQIGKLLFGSAAVSAFAEENSKKIAEQLQIKKYYFTLFNATEFSYYVIKQRYSKNMKAVIVARLITIIFHGLLHLLHQTKYRNLTYIFHMLFNIYSPILAVIIAKKIK